MMLNKYNIQYIVEKRDDYYMLVRYRSTDFCPIYYSKENIYEKSYPGPTTKEGSADIYVSINDNTISINTYYTNLRYWKNNGIIEVVDNDLLFENNLPLDMIVNYIRQDWLIGKLLSRLRVECV
jgi:hypothetical protein